MQRIILIDCYGFVFRAYHSLPPLTTKSGKPVGAVYGFTNMLIKLVSSMEFTHIAAVFDSGGKNFRHNLYDKYKANRPEAPQDLREQFPIMREVVNSINILAVEKVGYEADDIIATLAKIASKEGFEVLIISSDKDLMQLVSKNVKMFDPMKNIVIDEEGVKNKFGFYPEKVQDILALIGDKSDNIPGAAGIGEKTANELIGEFGSVENILDNVDKIQNERRRGLVLNSIDNILLSKALVKLDNEVATGISLEDLVFRQIDASKFVEFLNKQEFFSIANKVSKLFNVGILTNNDITHNTKASDKDVSYIKFKTENDINILLNSMQKNFNLIMLLEDAKENLLLYNYGGENEVILDIDFTKDNSLFSADKISLESLREIIKPILVNKSVMKISFGMKKFMLTFGGNISSFDDIQLMEYVLDTGRNYENLEEFLEFHGVNDQAKPSMLVSIREVYNQLSNEINEKSLNFVYRNIDKNLVKMLYRMQVRGIKIDSKILQNLSQKFEENIDKLASEVFALANCGEFNIGSPKQLSEILFDKIGFKPIGKKSKMGYFSTGSDILEEISLLENGEIADKILKWRHFTKLKNTYCDALPKYINSETKRIHGDFLNTSTITGRLSSKNPNLQNIPIKDSDGSMVRSAFIAETGNKLISTDYSQIELRIMAYIADVKRLISAFEDGMDIHQITASEIFGVKLDDVAMHLRRSAKAINFGIIYGISPFGLAKQLKISTNEAKNYIDKYFEKYSEIKDYMSQTQNFARENGFVKTIFGRILTIKDINSANHNIRNFANRLAINAPIQGSAADIIKKAMINLDSELEKSKMKCFITLQIHDELLIESPIDEIDQAKIIIKNVMENVTNLFPLKVDIAVSDNWNM